MRSIFEEEDGTIWLGTWGDGLLKMNRNFKVEQRFISDTLNTNTLQNDLVRTIKKGSDGKLWIGTNQGLCYLNLSTNEIKRVTNREFAAYPNELLELTRSKFENKNNLIIDRVGNYKDLTKSFEIIKIYFFSFFYKIPKV